AVAIVACAACRHVYRAQRPRPAEAAETYAEDHYGAARLAALFDSQLEQFRGKVRRLRALLDVAAPRIVVPALCPRKTIDNGLHGFSSPACGRNQTTSPPQRCSGGL
ncbi:MAG TPA: hypothetical protein VL049_07765, partial [Candidatus Dormibacteraeota bacterium]|nr:hypothetical protein [Candidatus Dormibacteraeota bacterium]